MTPAQEFESVAKSYPTDVVRLKATSCAGFNTPCKLSAFTISELVRPLTLADITIAE